MATTSPPEPIVDGMLDVGDGHCLYWEVCGNPHGKPAVVLHGGPGSGCTPWNRAWFDPDVYRVVCFDQRNCGRSTPHAGERVVDLTANTTGHLVGDIERLREHLRIERWLVSGISWGTTLALAYAQAHPDRVTAMALNSVTTTTRAEVDWITRAMGRVFPREWEEFCAAVPEPDRGGDLAAAFHRLLQHPDPAVHEPAAAAWCRWEDTHIATYSGYRPHPRYEDPRFRLGFARIVTHYFSHAAFLDDGALERDVPRLRDIPAVLLHGRLDIGSPPDVAWRLSRAWPASELVLLDDLGHGVTLADMRAATDRFR